MSELPSGWAKATLSELAEFNPKHDPSRLGEVVSFVPMPAVSAEFGTVEGAADRPLADVWKGFTHFAENDVIFAKITPCMENGKIAVAQGLTNGLGCGSTEFHVLRSNGAVLPEYLWRFLRQSSFRKDAEGAMTGAVGQRRVPTDYLKASELPFPSLAEQRRIVAKLDALTARTARARADLDRIPALAERYKQAIRQAAVDGDLLETRRAAERRAMPLKSAIARIRTGPFGSSLHKHEYVQGGVPLINPMHINDGRITPSPQMSVTQEKAAALGDFRLSSGDVVIARRGVMGRCAVVRDAEADWLIGTGSMAITPGAALDSEFLQLFLSSPTVVAALEANAVGSTMVNLNQGVLLKLEIRLPELDEQREVVSRVSTAFAEIDRMTAEAAAARRLLDRLDQAILARAFRGELVPQDPADEPASVLLERIRAERAAAPKPKRGRRKAAA